MKPLLLIAHLLICSSLLAQSPKITGFTDLEIAQALIGKKSSAIRTILKTYEIEYWFTADTEGKREIFIQYDNSIRHWKIDINTIYRTIGGFEASEADIVTDIFIRYRHNNYNDLKHMYKYVVPENADMITYERDLGSDLSHFKVKLQLTP